MKKILAIALTVAMILSMSTLLASAELPAGVTFTPGGYSTDAADFSALGTVKITWDAEANKKLDLSDGDMSDWADAGYNMVTLDTSNMVWWVNDTTNGTGVPAGWQISTYFVADSDWLYIGFFVTDPSHKVGVTGNYQSGDSFQVCIDFGGRLGQMLETDPDNLLNKKNIFYSFCNIGGEGAPIEIQFHGYRGDADRDLGGAIFRAFAVGRNALVIDHRASGRSDGNVISFGILEHRDCLAWVDRAIERFGPEVELHLTGISMGAATVLMAAGEPL